jgi:hypothetical protein
MMTGEPVGAMMIGEQLAELVTIFSAAISVVAIVIGAVISIRSFNFTRQKEAEASQIEHRNPFLNFVKDFTWKQQKKSQY